MPPKKPGPGRPEIPAKLRRVKTSVSISPASMAYLRKHAKGGVSIGGVIDRLISDAT